MTIRLLHIRSSHDRPLGALPAGASVTDQVVLDVHDRTATFAVTVRAVSLAGHVSAMVTAEPRLEELLRFAPGALAELCALVGQARRGESMELPLVLVDDVRPAAHAGSVG